MASIETIIGKKSKSYRVKYTYTDLKTGKKIPATTPTVKKYTEAVKLRNYYSSLEDEQSVLSPEKITLEELLDMWVKDYGARKWSPSRYNDVNGKIKNYINPKMGHVNIQKIFSVDLDRYYDDLKRTKPVKTKYCTPKTDFIPPKTIYSIHKLLRCAFNYAVKKRLLNSNPCDGCDITKPKDNKRKMWEMEEFSYCVDNCDNALLKLAMLCAVATSIRVGEVSGIRWSDVHITPIALKNETCSIRIEYQLRREDLEGLKATNYKNVVKVFQPKVPNSNSRLVLKTLKVDETDRNNYIPNELAKMLLEYKEKQEEEKKILGPEYQDEDLVFCFPDGTPIEPNRLTRWFKKHAKSLGLEPVDFHSLRHLSVALKLYLSGNDVKAVQGDTGHKSSSMVTDRYGRGLDISRRSIASKINTTIFKESITLTPKEEPKTGEEAVKDFMTQVQENPEMRDALLKMLLSSNM